MFSTTGLGNTGLSHGSTSQPSSEVNKPSSPAAQSAAPLAGMPSLPPSHTRGSKSFISTWLKRPTEKSPTIFSDKLDAAVTEARNKTNAEPIMKVLNDFDSKSGTGTGQRKLATVIAQKPAVAAKVREALAEVIQILKHEQDSLITAGLKLLNGATPYKGYIGPDDFVILFNLVRHLRTYLNNSPIPRESDVEHREMLEHFEKESLPLISSYAAPSFFQGRVPMEMQEAVFDYIEPDLKSGDDNAKRLNLERLMDAVATTKNGGCREKIDPKVLDRCFKLCAELAASVTYIVPNTMMRKVQQALIGLNEAQVEQLSRITAQLFPNSAWQQNTHAQELVSRRRPVEIVSTDSYDLKVYFLGSKYGSLQELAAELMSFGMNNIGEAAHFNSLRERGWTDESCADIIGRYALSWKDDESGLQAGQKMVQSS